MTPILLPTPLLFGEGGKGLLLISAVGSSLFPKQIAFIRKLGGGILSKSNNLCTCLLFSS